LETLIKEAFVRDPDTRILAKWLICRKGSRLYLGGDTRIDNLVVRGS